MEILNHRSVSKSFARNENNSGKGLEEEKAAASISKNTNSLWRLEYPYFHLKKSLSFAFQSNSVVAWTFEKDTACGSRIMHMMRTQAHRYERTAKLKWSALIGLTANESGTQTNTVNCYANVLTFEFFFYLILRVCFEHTNGTAVHYSDNACNYQGSAAVYILLAVRTLLQYT